MTSTNQNETLLNSKEICKLELNDKEIELVEASLSKEDHSRSNDEEEEDDDEDNIEANNEINLINESEENDDPIKLLHESSSSLLSLSSAAAVTITTTTTSSSANTDVLNWSQVNKLNELLTRSIQIDGRNNMPTLNVCLKDFIRFLHRKLLEKRIKVRDVRINGGVASYILANNHDYQYSDIDIIFACDLLSFSDIIDTTEESNTTTKHTATASSFRPISFNLESSFSNCCDVIKQTILECLLDCLPSHFNKENLTLQCLKESYVKKMAKIYTQCSTSSSCSTPAPSSSPLSCSQSSSSLLAESMDSLKSSSRWSLISLFNDLGQNIELKFVDKMKRQFQFSVDSFQIQLNSILSFYDYQDEMTENFFPSVIAESMYGNFGEALHHLNSKLIATDSPEQIRGGGLLKYCNLLIRDYKSLYDAQKMHTLEKYMCSRFFIDFSDIKEQEHKLRSYLDSHFCHDPQMCVTYLNKLYQVCFFFFFFFNFQFRECKSKMHFHCSSNIEIVYFYLEIAFEI